MPKKLIQVPPNILRIGLRKRSAIKYILGTIISVMKNAKASPNIMVQLSGFQNATLSPPQKMCGFSSENNVIKLMLKPMAIGINPKIAATAVSNTGIILVLPA